MIEQLLQKAEQLIGTGHFKKALKIVDKALAKDDMNAQGWYLRGKCYTALGKEQDAAYCYRKMKEVGGNPALAFTNLLRSITSVDERGQLKKEKRKYIDPNSLSSHIYFPNEETWVQQGTAAQRVGMYENALACYYRALQINPDYEPALRNKRQLLDMMSWEDGHPWDLFMKHVLGPLEPQEKEVLLKLREQTKLGIQLEEKIDPLPVTSYDKKLSVEIEDNKIVGLGIFHVVEELPDYITALNHLTDLYCNGSMLRAQIKEIPEAFKDLRHLQKLVLRSNALKELPEWIGDLHDLEWLDFHSNELTNLPETITKLSKLRTLDVRYNELTSLPKELGNCSELWWLDVGFNKLTELPSSLGKLGKLYTLKISNNSYKVMPPVAKELEKKGVKVEFEDQFL